MWRRFLWRVAPGALSFVAGDTFPIGSYQANDSRNLDNIPNVTGPPEGSPKLTRKRRFNIGKYKRQQSRINEMKELDDSLDAKKRELEALTLQIQTKSKGLDTEILQKRSILSMYENQISQKQDEHQLLVAQVLTESLQF